MDLLYKSAKAWKELTGYRYELIFGYKKTLYPINITFSAEDYPHLAGFQYLQDISLPNYTPKKLIERILEGKITIDNIECGQQFETAIKPRLEALINLKASLDNDFTFYTFAPSMYPFYTQIKADYLIASHADSVNFVFIIQMADSDNNEYHCCSLFKKASRDYEFNQSTRTLLKKTRINVNDGSSNIIIDKLNINSKK